MSDLSDADVYAYAPTGLIQILCMRMPMDAGHSSDEGHLPMALLPLIGSRWGLGRRERCKTAFVV